MIRLKFTRTGKSVTMEILHQDEEHRSTGIDKRFVASSGIEIRSHFHPQLDKKFIYLRGESTHLDEPIDFLTVRFATAFDARKAVARYIVAVREFNNQPEITIAE